MAEWSGELEPTATLHRVVAGSRTVTARSRGPPPPLGVISDMMIDMWNCIYVCVNILGIWAENGHDADPP